MLEPRWRPRRGRTSESIAALNAARASRVGDPDGGGGGGGGFRVLSYNLLADAHRHRWDDPRDGIHVLRTRAHCGGAAAAATARGGARLPCRRALPAGGRPQLVGGLRRPQLEEAGFRVHFGNKRHKDSQGVAAVRTSALELLELREMPLAPLAARTPARLLAAQPGTAAGVAALSSVGQPCCCARRAARGGRLLAHTHLYFANPAVHVRLLQTAALLHAAVAWRDELSAAAAAPRGDAPALLVAGDLNSDATDGVLHLLLRGTCLRTIVIGCWAGSLGAVEPPRESRAVLRAVR